MVIQMKNQQWLKGKWVQLLITLGLCTLSVAILTYFMNGIMPYGVPDAKDVLRVTVEDAQQVGVRKQYTDSEHIALACNLPGFLKYSYGKADTSQSHRITITYEKHDGTIVAIAGSENTLWWQGKAYPIKQEGAFLKLAQGVFFATE